MNSSDVRAKYIAFFQKRGHKEIPSANLVPENDPTTLFTSSGMQPLIPYLLGQKHPLGTRLVNSQKSFRAQDIDEVGDNRHTTFFEMLGNWSLGDYFKKEQLPWIFEFITAELGLDPKRLYVTVFEGNDSVPKDTESIALWKDIFAASGMQATVGTRIFTYPAKKNWWSRSGEPQNMPPGEPGGPDSEVFYDFGEELHLHEKSEFKHEKCHPNCDCGRFMEIANSVFMQYQKQKDGSLVELSQKNVDFGGGLERLVAATNNDPDVFKIDIFNNLRLKLVQGIEKVIQQGSNPAMSQQNDTRTNRIRIFLDHSRAAMFLISESIMPGKTEREYLLRRLIRRAQDQLSLLNLDSETYWKSAISHYKNIYKDVYSNDWDKEMFFGIIANELRLYGSVFKSVEKEKIELFNLITKTSISTASQEAGPIIFNYKSTFGIPYSVSEKLIGELNLIPNIVEKTYKEVLEKHRDLSRTSSKGKFKGGLADQSEKTTKLHTTHHLLLAALQKIVDSSIKQRGSNITAERLRIDVNFSRKLTPEEITKIEELVNKQIKNDLHVTRVEMKREDAEKIGAQMEFGQKYPDRVSVYIIGLVKGIKPETAAPSDYYSAEFCGGPHVIHTGELGTFAIQKEESSGAGIRRIYGTLT